MLVIFAAMNKEQGIGPTIVGFRQHLANPQVLAVDGNSCYKTVEIANAMGLGAICQRGMGKGDAATAAMGISWSVQIIWFSLVQITHRALGSAFY